MIDIRGLLISFALLLLAMTVHEFAHAWVAYLFGDKTAKYSGRLTLNPLAHIDPIGTVLLPLVLFIATSGRFVFGAAKPVPINYLALKNPKRDAIWIGLSGPAANFIFAALLSVFWRVPVLPVAVKSAFLYLIYINIILGVFNLVPIPPLDGSRIVAGILPDSAARKYALIEPFGFFIVMFLVWIGLFETLIWPLVKFILLVLRVPLE